MQMSPETQQNNDVRVSALASGSSGNAFLLEVAGINVLFDGGLNAPNLEYYLRQRGVPPSRLAAIFVSHEHIDHLRGVGVLSRRYNLPVVASAGTFRGGSFAFGSLPDKIVQTVGSEMFIGQANEIVVRTFSVSHDATEPVGFWIEALGRNIVICTDLGCETDSIREALKAADLLVLESNHDVNKLWKGPYPYALKKRVASNVGHLSNGEASRLISELAQSGANKTVWLAHLSEANNTPVMAFDAVKEPLDRDECAHIEVAVLARDKPSHVWNSAKIEQLIAK